MDDLRMGLGIDQLEIPAGLVEQVAGLASALPPAPRAIAEDSAADMAPMPVGALAGLAPWARRMDLPGVDS